MITPLPGVTETTPGSATRAFPGIRADILSGTGEEIGTGAGFLAIRRPWPAMLRGIWGDPERFQNTYWSKWTGMTVGAGDDRQPGEGVYFPGDGARRDEDGHFWIIGRIDDVLNVAGHRIGTMEVESALVDHPRVAEAAVVGKVHELKGQAIAAFVTLKEGNEPTPELKQELMQHVVRKIGAIARPDDILFSADLPKTRSGKIMRRLLKDIAEGRALGDTTTLADPAVVERLKGEYEGKEG
jgi:acetyl-CoA synthetase